MILLTIKLYDLDIKIYDLENTSIRNYKIPDSNPVFPENKSCIYVEHGTENKELDAEYDKLYGVGAAEYMRERKVNKWN